MKGVLAVVAAVVAVAALAQGDAFAAIALLLFAALLASFLKG